MTAFTNASDLLNALTDGAISTLDGLVSRRTGALSSTVQAMDFRRTSRSPGATAVTATAGNWRDLWTFEGYPSHGAVPGGTWATCDNTTDGALKQSNASGGRALRIMGALACLSNMPGTVMIYDRLGHVGGFSAVSAGTFNVNGGSPGTVSRYTTGERNFLAAEVYTVIGGGTANLTFTYTNQAGASKTSEACIIGAAGRQQVGDMWMANLSSGDYGVRDVTAGIMSAGTGSVGNWGITMGRPLYWITNALGTYATCASFVDAPVPVVLANACLAFAVMPGASVAPELDAFLEMLEA